MTEIIKEILKNLPEDKISDAVFEGANIVLYTKDKKFFLEESGLIKSIVNLIKKRIELRPDPKICLDPEKTEKAIRDILGSEVSLDNIIFDSQRSIVILEVDKPGLAIGKQGENLQKIKADTLWVPIIRRTPPIRSKIVENIRSVLYENSDYRRKFLHKTGQRIYNGWLRQKKEEWVRVTCLGAGRQVGRSCFLLQTPESRILLDCGIDVSSSENPYPYLEAPEFNIKDLDAIIVTHAHIDHSALVPYMYKFGFRGPTYCTAPTRDVMALLQLDCVKIQHAEGKEPLYTSEDIKEMVKHTICLDYEEVTDITPDIRITFYNAGHILGSAMVHIHIGNGLHNFIYSGDIKYGRTNLLTPTSTIFPRLETLMVEATYGAKEDIMPPAMEQDNMVIDLITTTIKRGGKVLIPTLGSGRGQEIVVLIERLIREGKMEKFPVYIDGMVWDITAIHTAYPEFLNSGVRQQIFHFDNNPFLADNIKRVGSQKERKEIIEDTGPCIILATSGMLHGGPSVEYLKHLAENPKNSLLFSCYQGEGTLGRKIMNGSRELNFQTGQKVETIPLKMEVGKIAVSAHADRRELMNFIRNCNPKPKKVIVVHGESSKCLDLSSSIHKMFRIETVAPRNLDTIRLK